jgi:hypothetical protein
MTALKVKNRCSITRNFLEKTSLRKSCESSLKSFVNLTLDPEQGNSLNHGHRFDLLRLHLDALHLRNRLRDEHHRMSDVTVVDT